MKVRTGIVCGMLILGCATPAAPQSEVVAVRQLVPTDLGLVGLVSFLVKQKQQRDAEMAQEQLQLDQERELIQLEKKQEQAELALQRQQQETAQSRQLPPVHIAQQCEPGQHQVRVVEPNGHQKYGCED